MPDQDGERMYRIKSPLEEYERVVKENTLAWSEDILPDLPDEPSERRRVGRRNITLPTLVPSEADEGCDGTRRHSASDGNECIGFLFRRPAPGRDRGGT
jgi:hypothetical protein